MSRFTIKNIKVLVAEDNSDFTKKQLWAKVQLGESCMAEYFYTHQDTFGDIMPSDFDNAFVEFFKKDEIEFDEYLSSIDVYLTTKNALQKLSALKERFQKNWDMCRCEIEEIRNLK